jgi:alpha-L-fucosidase
MLVDIVSRGGNLCLDIGPAADGQIPVIMQERLIQIGNWLKVNGDASYGTRMCVPPVQWSEGTRPETTRGEFMVPYNILKETLDPEPGQAVKEVFFTRKSDAVYAIVPRWPGKILRIKAEGRRLKAEVKSEDQRIKNEELSDRHASRVTRHDSPVTSHWSLVTDHISRITFLQTGESLRFRRSGNDLLITMPEYQPNSGWATEAYAFKIDLMN